MIRKFCDACGNEVGQLFPISIPCHLWEYRGDPGYIDGEGNSVSGRDNNVEVCRKCHNKAMDACAVELIKIASACEMGNITKQEH